MKRYVASALFALGLSSTAQAIQLEIRPLDPSIKAEVLGLQLEASGKEAVVLTRKVANDVARQAGVTIDSGTQMIVATGEEVSAILAGIAGHAAQTGKATLVNTQGLAKDVLAEIRRDIRDGSVVIVDLGDTALALIDELMEEANSTVITVIAAHATVVLDATDGLANLADELIEFAFGLVGLHIA